MVFIILILIVIAIVFVIFKFKKLPLDSVVMVNGSVGSGKTSTAVYLAIKSYKKELRAYKIRKFLHLKVEKEKPLLYSNIPLFKVDYVPLTQDLLLRKKRFNYKSIVLISESSLVANSQANKNQYVNDKLTLWLKLIRHSLHGTYCKVPNLIVETQSINDNHYSFDRCITQSLYITKKFNIPFFRIVKARELLLFDSVINNIEDDLEKACMRWYIVPKSVFKKYDSYCYSILTDNLCKVDNVIHHDIKSKQVFEICTLLKNIELKEYNKQFNSVQDADLTKSWDNKKNDEKEVLNNER